MGEHCPANLDTEGKSLWEQCSWIIEGGAIDPSTSLQLQALAIRRELRMESLLKRQRKEFASLVRDIACRIGPGRLPESIREELMRLASHYDPI